MLTQVHGHRERGAISSRRGVRLVLREIGKTLADRVARLASAKSTVIIRRMTMPSLYDTGVGNARRRPSAARPTELSALAALAYATLDGAH